MNQVNEHLFEPGHEAITGGEHRISAAYHPQTSGLHERFNQTLVNALTKMSGDKQEKWDQLFAHRYAIHVHKEIASLPVYLPFLCLL